MEKVTGITSNPWMQGVSPRGNGYEFTPAGVRTLQIFRQKWLLEASHTLESYSSSHLSQGLFSPSSHFCNLPPRPLM